MNGQRAVTLESDDMSDGSSTHWMENTRKESVNIVRCGWNEHDIYKNYRINQKDNQSMDKRWRTRLLDSRNE
jgi:hypothetical protein